MAQVLWRRVVVAAGELRRQATSIAAGPGPKASAENAYEI